MSHTRHDVNSVSEARVLKQSATTQIMPYHKPPASPASNLSFDETKHGKPRSFCTLATQLQIQPPHKSASPRPNSCPRVVAVCPLSSTTSTAIAMALWECWSHNRLGAVFVSTAMVSKNTLSLRSRWKSRLCGGNMLLALHRDLCLNGSLMLHQLHNPRKAD